MRFIPRPVIIGFTNGIALLIASTQIKDFFGIAAEHVPGDFLGRLHVLAAQAGSFSPAATALASVSLLTMIGVVRFAGRVPPTLVALLGGTVAAVLAGLPVDTIGSRFGGIPAGCRACTCPPSGLT